MRVRGRHSGLLQAWAILALAAILFRALIPMGYMAQVDRATGAIEIAMCTADGHQTVTVELPAGAPEAPEDADPTCPFALAGLPVIEAPPAVSVAAELSIALEHSVLHVLALSSRPFPPHAPPTGPPVLA